MIAKGAQAQDGPDYGTDEAQRLARGWQVAVRFHERLRRRDEGRPLLEIVKDKNPVRARASE